MKNKILSALSIAGTYISGEQLSEILGVSRTTVWNYIKQLRAEGYIIDSVTNKGYKLISSPDRLNPGLIMQKYTPCLIGTKIVILPETDSTNEEIKRRAAMGEKSGLVVAAETQTRGKGRLGRTWSSQSGGLFFSFLLRTELPPSDVTGITLAAGYAVCLGIREFAGINAKIKWPNDIIIGNKKICGILTEMTAQPDQTEYIICGIGINVNIRDFPEEIRSKCSSLLIETGRQTDRSKLLGYVIEKLDKVLSSFMLSLSVDDMVSFRELCATLGRKITFTRGKEKIEATAVDIGSDGELIARDDMGKEYAINSGEVTVQGIY